MYYIGFLRIPHSLFQAVNCLRRHQNSFNFSHALSLNQPQNSLQKYSSIHKILKQTQKYSSIHKNTQAYTKILKYTPNYFLKKLQLIKTHIKTMKKHTNAPKTTQQTTTHAKHTRRGELFFMHIDVIFSRVLARCCTWYFTKNADSNSLKNFLKLKLRGENSLKES